MWASLACLCLIGACLIKTCPQRRKCLEQTCQLIKLWGLAIAEQIIVQSKFWSKFTVFALVSSPSRSPHSHSHQKTWIYELKSYLFQINGENYNLSLVQRGLTYFLVVFEIYVTDFPFPTGTPQIGLGLSNIAVTKHQQTKSALTKQHC